MPFTCVQVRRRNIEKIIFVMVLYIIVVSSEEYLEIQTLQGPVHGYKSSEDIYEFYGIPYATAPTGLHKFRAPLEPPTWHKPFEATDRRIACPQDDQIRQFNVTVREDCLITNIYVPNTKEKKLPVVVFIHGGGYYTGYAETVSPKELVKTKRVIALNFNYRLGAYGFLCLGTKVAPGNAGLKDQVALLRWVKNNIAFFGGDPNDVTLAGCSAGGSAIDLHILSKMSKELFKKIIPESGANIGFIQSDPIANAKTFAKLLNFNKVDTIQDIEHFYITANYSILTSSKFLVRLDSSLIFMPCIERDIGEEVFLHDDPINILKSSDYMKIPMLYGFNEMEGTLLLPNFKIRSDLMNKNFTSFLPSNLDFKNDKQEVVMKVKHFYFGDKDVSIDNVIDYVNYFSDASFSIPMLRSAKLQVEAGNNRVYLYHYSYFDDSMSYNSFEDLQSAGHCYQSYAVLDEATDGLSDDYKKVKTVMRDLWLNFIIYGKPVLPDSNYPNWPPTRKDKNLYMSINKTLELKEDLYPERMKLWDGIYEKYYRQPIPPNAINNTTHNTLLSAIIW